MLHTIGPFPTIHGGHAFPGHLSSEDATPLEPIHKRLRANISIHPDQVEHLVCKAVQQCYDMLKRIHARRGPLNKYVLEEALPEKAFHIALECGWLPEGARTDSPAWRGWIRQLLEGRFSRVGLEASCKPDPYLSVPFPVVASGGKAFVVTAAAGKGGKGEGPILQFPNRASWLKDRLQERSWNKHDVSRQGGPDRKTVQKILDSQQIREDVLEKLATALSKAPASKKLPNVTVLDVPRD